MEKYLTIDVFSFLVGLILISAFIAAIIISEVKNKMSYSSPFCCAVCKEYPCMHSYNNRIDCRVYKAFKEDEQGWIEGYKEKMENERA